MDKLALSISEKPSNTTPHHGRGKKSENKFCRSQRKISLAVIISPYDDEFSPAYVVSFARVFGAPYLTSSLPLTSLHCIFWNVRYFPYHLAEAVQPLPNSY